MALDGNAYWMIVRNGLGRPAELWYIPHWLIEPKWPANGSVFISHYVYSPGGGAASMEIDPAAVIHFRHGLHPHNPRKGLSHGSASVGDRVRPPVSFSSLART